MSPRALLLSPDDQAVSAITGVLQELSVSCERPLDGPTAAQKLHSQAYDLVLVDCDNLPAAKLIFDVCRRKRVGANSIPIAIVDGRAGLPTAFRLGAELILTKPVSKDQARNTIRAAVGRIKKEEPAAAAAEVPEASEPATLESVAQAAAASATLTPSVPASTPAEPAQPETPLVTNLAPETESVTTEASAVVPAPLLTAELAQAASVSDTPPVLEESAPSLPQQAEEEPISGEGPLFAELDQKLDQKKELPPPPVFSSYQPRPRAKAKKSHAFRTVLLLIILAAVASTTAWIYVPEFRQAVTPWLGRAKAFIVKRAPVTFSVRQVPAPANVSTPAPGAAVAGPGSATSSPTEADGNQAPGVAPAAASAGQQPPATVGQTTTGAPTGAAPVAGTTTPATTATPQEKASPGQVELAGAKDALVLSSKGAAKRLIHQVAPAYPAEARARGIEGTVVLKALVNANGVVQEIRAVEGNPILTEAAINAVKQWRYAPFERDGKRLPFQTIVLVDFPQP